jgi:hypothetical protein
LNPASPILIQPGASAKTTFNAGQESNQPSKVSILIHATAGTDTPNISAKLNGNSLETGVALDGDWIEFTAKQEWLRTGTNEVEVTTHNAAGKPTRWTDLRCTVRYDSKKTP